MPLIVHYSLTEGGWFVLLLCRIAGRVYFLSLHFWKSAGYKSDSPSKTNRMELVQSCTSTPRLCAEIWGSPEKQPLGFGCPWYTAAYRRHTSFLSGRESRRATVGGGAWVSRQTHHSQKEQTPGLSLWTSYMDLKRRRVYINRDDISSFNHCCVLKVPSCGGGTEMSVYPPKKLKTGRERR